MTALMRGTRGDGSRPWVTRNREIAAEAPVLRPKLWYGMPAYARDGKIVCFFQPARKSRTRYATFGFQHEANLDEGHLWPVAFAVTELTADDEERIAALVRKAVS